jgi:crotonobetainyl-CoA:carnitine CoA-transferase CaiB-like acyl-CoA transferase
MPWAVIGPPENNLEVDHYKTRGYWASVEHEEIGTTVIYPRGLYSDDELGAMPTRRAPHLGEQTHAVLHDELGLDDTVIDTLTQTGVIR